METKNVKAAEGKLGVLVVGLGAVSTTFIHYWRANDTQRLGKAYRFDDAV